MPSFRIKVSSNISWAGEERQINCRKNKQKQVVALMGGVKVKDKIFPWVNEDRRHREAKMATR
jgi:hypothetical protein